MTVSARTLHVLSAMVWYVGGVVLLRKAAILLLHAHALSPGQDCIILAVAAGLLLGGLKAKFIFSRSCRRNLARITGLTEPKVWQFFRPGFFVALAGMIATGALLSRLAHVDTRYLCFVAAVDLTIAVALLGSSYVFWQRRALP